MVTMRDGLSLRKTNFWWVVREPDGVEQSLVSGESHWVSPKTNTSPVGGENAALTLLVLRGGQIMFE